MFNTVGVDNVAIGSNTLLLNTTGSGNVAIGAEAGFYGGSGSIWIGNTGVYGDAPNTIRIGEYQSRSFIAGIRGTTTDIADAITVVIDSAGQLGTVSSSRRYKRDIADMAEASSPVLELRPVTFRYGSEGEGGPQRYGLIAEEVAAVLPALVVVDAQGQPDAVLYRLLTPLLLNEVQRLDRELRELRAQLAALPTAAKHE